MPQAGFLLGLGFVLIGAVLAYVAATFIIETITITNALRALRGEGEGPAAGEQQQEDTLHEGLVYNDRKGAQSCDDPAIYDINVRYEVAQY